MTYYVPSSAKVGEHVPVSPTKLRPRLCNCSFQQIWQNRQGLFTPGPSKAESSQADRGDVFALGIMFTLGCVGCYASEVRHAARIYPGCLV